MMKSKVVGVVGLLGALVVSGYGHDVVAQAAGLAIGGSASNYGQTTLAPGFLPDPVTVQVTSGGGINVSSLNLAPGCVGYVTRQPDYILHMSGNSSALRLTVTVPGARPVTATDTTLVVNDPHGGWHCNDDTNGANPALSLAGLGAGQYDIWIGSYVANRRARGTLAITERP